MKLISLLSVLLIFFVKNSDAKKDMFNPIATINATTVDKGKFSFARAPLGNLNTTFLASSLNYGLFDRFEIGTAPIFYLSSEHKGNYNLKALVYDGDITKWSFSAGSLIFETEIENNGEIENPDVEMSIVQLAVNIHVPDSLFTVGLSAGRSCGQIDSKNVYVKIYSFRCKDETGFDLQYQYNDDLWITLGQGRNREAGITPYESIVNGYGAAVTLFRKAKLISRPSLGYYVSENGENMFLMTTTFYEN
ncbi:MAG: hypothetical protein HON90_17565 [Halobacteriovoraceae bacterium]|jgi:hypothetical protein|nr:hypothetical protein [Halobacteriovoraceae bacterium]